MLLLAVVTPVYNTVEKKRLPMILYGTKKMCFPTLLLNKILETDHCIKNNKHSIYYKNDAMKPSTLMSRLLHIQQY